VKLGKLMVFLTLFPSISGSSEYLRVIYPDAVIEKRADRVLIRQRSDLSRRIEQFALQHGASTTMAPEIAELLEGLEHGPLLAAIAAHESRFDCSALGKAGELGAYQVQPGIWGDPGTSFYSQTDNAISILQELLESSGGDIGGALEHYNGKGLKARKYASRVLRLANSI